MYCSHVYAREFGLELGAVVAHSHHPVCTGSSVDMYPQSASWIILQLLLTLDLFLVLLHDTMALWPSMLEA